jgi:hypothetical protein
VILRQRGRNYDRSRPIVTIENIQQAGTAWDEPVIHYTATASDRAANLMVTGI